MPMLELTADELIVHLSWWEAIASFQKSIHIPLGHIRGATDDAGFRGWKLGIRAPGTGIPGVISAGTYLKEGDRQFVFVTGNTHPVVIELTQERWSRMILGVKDARCAANEINAALKRA